MDEAIPKIPSQSLTGRNFIQQAAPETKQLITPKFYKQAIVHTFTLLSALWTGYAYSRLLSSAGGLWMFLAAAGTFAIFASIEIFLTKVFSQRIAFVVVEAIFLLAPFIGYNSGALAITGLMIIVFLLWGELLAYGELENTIEIRFFKVLKRFVTKLTTALVIFMAVLYMQQWNEKNIFLSRGNFQNLYSGSTSAVRTIYPDVDFNSTFMVAMRGIARSELQKNPEFNGTPALNQEANIRYLADELASSTSRTLGIVISPEAKASDVFYDLIVKFLKQLQERFQGLFLIVWALVVFFVIRELGVIFYWIVMLVSFILYEALLAFNFIHIAGVSKTHEVIEF